MPNRSAVRPTTSPLNDPRRRAVQDLFGAELREVRERLGMTQTALADVFGWDKSTISKVELGNINITLYDAMVLAHSLRFADGFPADHPLMLLADRYLMPKSKARSKPKAVGTGGD